MGQEAEPSEPVSAELRPAWIASREVQEQDIAGVLEETTYWVQVGAARLAQLQGLLDCARDNGSNGLVAVVVEGGAGHLVLPRASRLNSDGFVILNLPLPRTSGQASRNALSVMQAPSLLVQESPLDWPEDQALGPGVQLLRSPPGHSGRDDDRVLRRLRGWLQRQAAG